MYSLDCGLQGGRSRSGGSSRPLHTPLRQETEWYIYVDDDTYVLMEPLMALLRR